MNVAEIVKRTASSWRLRGQCDTLFARVTPCHCIFNKAVTSVYRVYIISQYNVK